MTTIVGLDLHHRSAGALRLGAWFVGTRGEKLRCLHVISESFLRHSAAFEALPDIMERERKAAESVVLGILGNVPFELELRRGDDPSDVLVELSGPEDTLIIGRSAARQDHTPFRLGSVARRVLRKSRAPVIVVPPNLEHVGAGPIILASSCDEAANRALAFARKLSERQARPLLVAHAIETPDLGRWAASRGHASAVLDTYASERVLAARRSLEGWAKVQGLLSEQVQLLEGSEGPTEQLVTFAARHDAALLVTAPHSRSYVQQIVGTSFSGELAGYAQCPVAVV